MIATIKATAAIGLPRFMLALLSLVMITTSARPADRDLAVSLPTQVAPKAVELIAKYGLSDTLQLDAGTNLAEVIVARCATLDPVYAQTLLDADGNKDKLDLSDFRGLRTALSVTMPACARAPVSRQTTLQDSLSISDLADRKYIPLDSNVTVGSTSLSAKSHALTIAVQALSPALDVINGTVLDALKKAIMARSKNDPKDPDGIAALKSYYGTLNAQVIVAQKLNVKHLTNSTPIVFPAWEPVWTTIKINPRFDIDIVATELRAADIDVKKSADVFLISGIDSADSDKIGECRAAGQFASQWPINIDDLTRVMALNNALRPFQGRDLIDTNLLVVDTGFESKLIDMFAFPKNYLRRLEPILPLRGKAPVGLVQGVNLAGLTENRNDFTTIEGYPERFHGVSVVNVAMGGRTLDSLRRMVTRPLVSVAIANSVGKLADASNLNTASYQIDAQAIRDAYDVALANHVSVINVSASSNRPIPSLDTKMKAVSDRVVLVAAAGNDFNNADRDLSQTPAWPASYGGNPSNGPGGATVITVGASDMSGILTPFSKYGREVVDLLAPGCRIPTYGVRVAADGEISTYPTLVSGTSFAAPLVSFVATMLAEENLSPAAIKNRLIASVNEHVVANPDNPSDNLEDKVWSRGVLNPTKALAIYRDVLTVFRDGIFETWIGTIAEDPLLKFCGDKNGFHRADIAKLSIVDSGRDRYVIRKWMVSKSNNGALERAEPCETNDGDVVTLSTQITFTDAFTMQSTIVKISDIRDWVLPVWK